MLDSDWCSAAIAASAGVPARITSVMPVPSRTGRVWRITALVGGAEQAFYAKKYASDDISAAALRRRYRDLREIGAALEGHPGIVPFVPVAVDADRRVLLTLEIRGIALGVVQRRLAWSKTTRVRALNTWGTVGAFLSLLHRQSLPTRTSSTWPRELERYTLRRLEMWRTEAPPFAALADRAKAAVRLAAEATSGTPVTLVPCHGDVTTFNIVVGGDVGLIDLDDFRFDLPALDISQALQEIDQFSTVASTIPLTAFGRRARELFLEGYGRPLPGGAEFWLPHLRNLAVKVLTLARRRGPFISRWTTDFHYRRVVAEVDRSVRRILSSGARDDYFRVA